MLAVKQNENLSSDIFFSIKGQKPDRTKVRYTTNKYSLAGWAGAVMWVGRDSAWVGGSCNVAEQGLNALKSSLWGYDLGLMATIWASWLGFGL